MEEKSLPLRYNRPSCQLSLLGGKPSNTDVSDLSLFFPVPQRSHNQVGSAALTNNNWVLMGKAGTPTHFQQADLLARTPCLRAVCHWLGAAYHCCLTSKAPFYL